MLKVNKLRKEIVSSPLATLPKDAKLRLEIPEEQLLTLQRLHAKFEELEGLIDRRLKQLAVLVNPGDLSARFRSEETLLENAYKFVREVERRLSNVKPQNYENQACKNFNSQFDAAEKIIVQTNPEQTNKNEINFIFDMNKAG